MLRLIPTFASLILLSTVALAQTPTISLKAVKINDVAIARSNSITVNPGDIIEAEIFASEWSPNGERLSGYQASIDRASFGSGETGSIKPLGWDRPLALLDDIECLVSKDDDCPQEFPVCLPTFGGLGHCVGLEYDPGLGIFIDDLRADWVLFPCNSSRAPCWAIVLLDVSARIRYGGVLFERSDSTTYGPPEKYCGTMKLVVSSNASGAFRFDIRPAPNSGLFDDGPSRNAIEPLNRIGLTIDVIEPPVGIPTVSGWGVCILALVLLTIGKTYFGRRHRATASVNDAP